MNEFEKIRPSYVALANKVEILLQDICKTYGIKYNEISSRAKDVNSFRKKVLRKKYTDPLGQITDLAGIRVILYFEETQVQICQIIERLFVIDTDNSVDKSKILGNDRFGYRSVHYICMFDDRRTALPEFKKFKGLFFEIQIRTILEHAWAEIYHDPVYKSEVPLPDKYIRRLNRVAALLEAADSDLNILMKEIGSYYQNIDVVRIFGEINSNTEVNENSLRQYMVTKFDSLINKGLQPVFGRNDDPLTLLNELKDVGIKTIEDLDKIIPKDIAENMECIITEINFASLLRIIIIIHYKDEYFSIAWKHNWKLIKPNIVKLLQIYNINLVNYDILIIDSDEYELSGEEG